MNKSDLIQKIADRTEIAKAQVEKVINAFTETVVGALKEDEKVTLVGFGTFQVSKRKETTGVNPQTRQKITIPARNVAKLKFSDSINKELN